MLILALAAALVAALAFTAATASIASAQGSGSDLCAEYPDLPGCADDPSANPDPAVADGPSATVAGDDLPFTGYPLTALILLLLALLLVGLAIRGYLAVRERTAGNRAAGP